MNRYLSFMAMAGVVVCCVGCSGKHTSESPVQSEKAFDKERVLTVRDSVEIDDVFRLRSWKFSDDRVCFLDRTSADTLLHVYSFPKGELIRSFLSIGNGPEQFVVVNPGEGKGDKDMLIYDIMKRRVRIYDIGADSTAPSVDYALPVDSTGLAIPYTAITQVNDSVFLMKMDSDEKSVWQMADLKNNRIIWEHPNPYRDATTSYTPFDFIQVVADSTIIVAYRYMDLIETYSFSPESEMRRKTTCGSVEDLSALTDYDDLPYRNISVAKGKGNFYCLRSSDGDDCGYVVEVYDSSTGKAKEVYTLDKIVTSIGVCGNQLVGYNQSDNGTILYIWDL